MTKIIAHRGASKYAPENTLPAFELAYEMKADGIETDVQLTRDNVPILIHDEQLKRTTDGTGWIKDYTYEEIKELDAGSWFSKEFYKSPILTLEEFLQWAQFKPIYLHIELKNNKIEYKDIENMVFEMVEHFQLLDRTTLSTFNPESVKRLKPKNTKIEVALLTSKKSSNLILEAKELGANALHVKYRLLNSSLSMQSRKQNIPLRIYTVNSYRTIKKCIDLKCDSIFTDVPDKAKLYNTINN